MQIKNEVKVTVFGDPIEATAIEFVRLLHLVYEGHQNKVSAAELMVGKMGIHGEHSSWALRLSELMEEDLSEGREVCRITLLRRRRVEV